MVYLPVINTIRINIRYLFITVMPVSVRTVQKPWLRTNTSLKFLTSIKRFRVDLRRGTKMHISDSIMQK